MSQHAENETILLVANEYECRVFLSNVMDDAGKSFIIARNMSEGLRITKSAKPALIILDVMMTNREGIEMYYHLKNDHAMRKIPVILLSSIDRDTFFQYEKFHSSFPESGILEPDAYVEKPPEAEELIQLVQQLKRKGAKAPMPKTDVPSKTRPCCTSQTNQKEFNINDTDDVGG